MALQPLWGDEQLVWTVDTYALWRVHRGLFICIICIITMWEESRKFFFFFLVWRAQFFLLRVLIPGVMARRGEEDPGEVVKTSLLLWEYMLVWCWLTLRSSEEHIYCTGRIKTFQGGLRRMHLFFDILTKDYLLWTLTCKKNSRGSLRYLILLSDTLMCYG